MYVCVYIYIYTHINTNNTTNNNSIDKHTNNNDINIHKHNNNYTSNNMCAALEYHCNGVWARHLSICLFNRDPHRTNPHPHLQTFIKSKSCDKHDKR